MAFRFLLLCLACVHLGLAAPFGDDGKEIVRSKRQSPSPAPPTPFPEVLVDFSVRRLGTDLMEMFRVQEDPFCDKGLDAPGNITIHTFYRDRLEDDDGVGNWTFLQRSSAQIGAKKPLYTHRFLCRHSLFTYLKLCLLYIPAAIVLM